MNRSRITAALFAIGLAAVAIGAAFTNALIAGPGLVVMLLSDQVARRIEARTQAMTRGTRVFQ